MHPSARRGSDHGKDRGFTLIETLIVLVLATATLSMFAGFYSRAVDTVQGDAGMRIMGWQLKVAREMAINQRRSVEVQFTPPNMVRLVRREIPNGTTVLQTAVLEHHTQFALFSGQPDTPDSFGRPDAVSFSGAATVMFTADGMLVDATGNPVNGTVFLGQPGKPFTARALTITGATATIRTYRWNGSQWRR